MGVPGVTKYPNLLFSLIALGTISLSPLSALAEQRPSPSLTPFPTPTATPAPVKIPVHEIPFFGEIFEDATVTCGYDSSGNISAEGTIEFDLDDIFEGIADTCNDLDITASNDTVGCNITLNDNSPLGDIIDKVELTYNHQTDEKKVVVKSGTFTYRCTVNEDESVTGSISVQHGPITTSVGVSPHDTPVDCSLVLPIFGGKCKVRETWSPRGGEYDASVLFDLRY